MSKTNYLQEVMKMLEDYFLRSHGDLDTADEIKELRLRMEKDYGLE